MPTNDTISAPCGGPAVGWRRSGNEEVLVALQVELPDTFNAGARGVRWR